MEIPSSGLHSYRACTHRPIMAYDSCCSTPYASAPSSPGRHCDFYYSAPPSPIHFAISTAFLQPDPSASEAGSAPFEFDFHTAEFMTSADELFRNGQIRSMKHSAHLQRRQSLAPLTESDAEEDREVFGRGRELKMRAGSLRGRTRSMSPLRTTPTENNEELLPGCDGAPPQPPPPCGSRSSSRRWIFLKEFLYRSKSEGNSRNERQNGKFFWASLSFSPVKDIKKTAPPATFGGCNNDKNDKYSANTECKLMGKVVSSEKEDAAAGKRKGRSAHEVHYTAKRAEAEEMRKKTFLPYRQGLLGCFVVQVQELWHH